MEHHTPTDADVIDAYQEQVARLESLMRFACDQIDWWARQAGEKDPAAYSAPYRDEVGAIRRRRWRAEGIAIPPEPTKED